MSFLTPLYFAGLAAISLPIIFHLIRREPRGRTFFSSLMFLQPSPPTFTRRKRLDNWLLLLLRALALILMALAFARPFMRQQESTAVDDQLGRQVVLLLDKSASMRRDGVWSRARQQVESALGELRPLDDVALMTFDSDVDTVVAFPELGAVATNNKQLIRDSLGDIEPTWAATNLGGALVAVADQLMSTATHDFERPRAAQIVLISDFQEGAALSALQTYEWPGNISVQVRTVTLSQPGNASVELLPKTEYTDSSDARIRVTNSADASGEQFYVSWAGPGGPLAESREVAAYVPPGETRVVRVPWPTDPTVVDRVVLTGDNCGFDNTFFINPAVRQQLSVVYLGNDTVDDPQGVPYYLRLALDDDPLRDVTINTHIPDNAIDLTQMENLHLAVVASAVPADIAEELKKFTIRGGTILWVPSDHVAAQSLAESMSDVTMADAPDNVDYHLLGEIDFGHPFFSQFANPRYSDFTKIHFWRRHAFTIKHDSTVHVLARFDDGTPALWQQKADEGNWLVLASGWNPSDSQLALSTKFLPLIHSILDQASGYRAREMRLHIGDALPIASFAEKSTQWQITSPDGTTISVSDVDAGFADTHTPGHYVAQSVDAAHTVAVNLPPSESMTVARDNSALKQLGVSLGTTAAEELSQDQTRQLRDVELEGRQKMWRWLLLMALALLAAETWLAAVQQQREPVLPSPQGATA